AIIGKNVGQQRWLSCAVAFALSVGSAAASHAGIGGTNRLAAVKGGAAGELEVLGVVETSAASGLVVSGQTVRLTTSALQAALPAKGALVAVYGSLLADGTISASQVSEVGQAYVPGATTLYIRGVVKSVNASVGRAQVGSLSIDYTAALYESSDAGIKPGSVVEFSGLQSSASTLFASRVSASGIGGTNHANGIGGTNVVANGIGGTNVAANGIGGTNAVANGIGGTNRANGIGGTNVTANGIGGTNAVANGIGGTNRANGIGGTNVTANGIGGTNVTANGIGGTNVSANGIGGTNRANGIGGTNVTANGI